MTCWSRACSSAACIRATSARVKKCSPSLALIEITAACRATPAWITLIAAAVKFALLDVASCGHQDDVEGGAGRDRVHHLGVLDFLVVSEVGRRGPGDGVDDLQLGRGQAEPAVERGQVLADIGGRRGFGQFGHDHGFPAAVDSPAEQRRDAVGHLVRPRAVARRLLYPGRRAVQRRGRGGCGCRGRRRLPVAARTRTRRSGKPSGARRRATATSAAADVAAVRCAVVSARSCSCASRFLIWVLAGPPLCQTRGVVAAGR